MKRALTRSARGEPGSDGLAGITVAAAPAPAPEEDLIGLLESTVRANARLSYRVRCGLAVFGLSCGVLALGFVVARAGEIVDKTKLPTMPALLVAVLGALAGVAAWAVHDREVKELYASVDTISRMKREGEVAVSARGLIYAFEEKLQNARRAFTLLLWLGRTLFVVCLGLFAAAVITAMDHQPVMSVAFGVSSVAGALLGVVKAVPRNIGHALADVVQIQSVITGFDRQISLLESAAFNAMNSTEDRTVVYDRVLEVQARMDSVVESAIGRIERYADPEPRGHDKE